LVPIFGATAAKRAKLDNEEFELYGKLISSKLRHLSNKDRKACLQLQTAIFNLLFKEDDEGFELYGKLVSSKLRTISSKNRKSFLEIQSAINTWLFREELKVSTVTK